MVDGALMIGNLMHVNSQIQNNIFIGTFDVPTNVGLTFSNNCWSTAPPTNAIGTGDVIGNPELAQTGSTEAGLLSADFFKLLANSPAIDKGIVLASVTEDFFRVGRGTMPDIGGYEYFNLDIYSVSPNLFKLYPNPAKDNFTINLSDFREEEQIQVFNLLGKLIIELNLTSSKQQINVENFPSGLYFISLKQFPQSTIKFLKL